MTQTMGEVERLINRAIAFPQQRMRGLEGMALAFDDALTLIDELSNALAAENSRADVAESNVAEVGKWNREVFSRAQRAETIASIAVEGLREIDSRSYSDMSLKDIARTTLAKIEAEKGKADHIPDSKEMVSPSHKSHTSHTDQGLDNAG